MSRRRSGAVTPMRSRLRKGPARPAPTETGNEKGSLAITFRLLGDRRLVAVLITVAAVAAAVFVGIASGAGPASPGQGRGPETYTIGLFGDMPYGALGRSQYPSLLADFSQSHVAFSIFDGDLQAGGDGPCSDSLYSTALANFNTLERPLAWVPGDNDWTDCWGRYGPAQQPYHDPIERLNHERQLFDSTDQSLGQKTLTLTRESSEGGAYAVYSENVRWVYGPVVYIGLNVQGSNDNSPYHETDAENGAAVVRRPNRDDGLPRAGRAGARRLALLQGRHADQPAERRRPRELHARRDLRRASDPPGQRHDRPAGPEPVRVRAAHRRGQRRLTITQGGGPAPAGPPRVIGPAALPRLPLLQGVREAHRSTPLKRVASELEGGCE